MGLFRIRYRLTIHARRERLHLGEETALVALQSNEAASINNDVLKLLYAEASSYLAISTQIRFSERVGRTLTETSRPRASSRVAAWEGLQQTAKRPHVDLLLSRHWGKKNTGQVAHRGEA